MRVPLLDLSEQYRALSGEIRAATHEVLSSQRFILGPKLAEFEKAVAKNVPLARIWRCQSIRKSRGMRRNI